MKHRYLLALAALFPIAVTAAECAPADAQTLRQLKQEHWPQLYRDQDVEGLDAFLLDGSHSIDADGARTTKAEELAWLRDHAWKSEGFTYAIDSIECFGDTSIIIGRGSSLHEAEGRTFRDTYASSNVFVKVDGRWRVAGSHLSKSTRAPAD